MAIANVLLTGAKARWSRSFSDVTWTTASFPPGIDAVFFLEFSKWNSPAPATRPSSMKASVIS